MDTGGGMYGAWCGYPYDETINYQEGTLNIDLVDSKRKAFVWQGNVEGRVAGESIPVQAPRSIRSSARFFRIFQPRLRSNSNAIPIRIRH
jgi:hypothetical protein